MSRPPAGRLHLSFWVAVGVLLYLASCPPVEAWHEKRAGHGARSLPMRASSVANSPGTPGAALSVGASVATSTTDAGDFEISEVQYYEPPPQPRWLQILYGPVHWLEKFAPFETIFHRYREWCDAAM
jgi:hypothetical protein